MFKYILVLFLIILLSFHSQSQHTDLKGPLDSRSEILLKNRYIEIETTIAMFDMYNFNFDRAEKEFRYLKKQYPWHPLPYFLIGLNYYWRLLPYDYEETPWDNMFLAYMDSTVMLAENLYEKANKVEGSFFLAASNGFVGRYHGDRGNYTRAAFSGKSALKYLEICRENEDFSPEILFGVALFNYYVEWISENYKILRPFLMFFPDGNKELGIQQLEKTAANAYYARTEAQMYLMRIMMEEGRRLESKQLAEYLHKQYPNNAYFHRYYALTLYQTGDYSTNKSVCLEIIKRFENKQVGYENNSMRYANYFLGQIYLSENKFDSAKLSFEQAMKFCELANATDKGYYFYSIFYLGKTYAKMNDLDKAEYYYKMTKKVANRRHDAFSTANDALKTLKKLRKSQ